MSKVVEIFEGGPRDGVQNEKKNINTADKIKLIDALSECGLKKIEVSSFVSSKWIPQLADAKYVFENITRNSSVKYTALTPNMKGLNAAKSANVDEVAIFAAASETFSQKNINWKPFHNIAYRCFTIDKWINYFCGTWFIFVTSFYISN